jgi:2-polyprenyl-6-methoxyphenol hydroxylase-like FAD-dependent oxidoreductase
MYERSAGYGGTWGKIREDIGPDSNVSHTRIEWLLVDAPWYRGRAIVIGDAAHACPPLIAQGAAMCVEDAVVLAELVTGTLPVEQALPAFMARRMPRVELVVRNSMLLVRWEMGLEPHTDADVARTMNSTLGFLAAVEA